MSPTAEGVLTSPPETSHLAEPKIAPHELLRDRRRLYEHLRQGGDPKPIILTATATAIVGAAIFGIALGSYAQTASQILASGLKLPILLVGSALLCFPCFHILQGWRAPRPLDLGSSLALQTLVLASVGLVWGSLAPPLLFLVGSTQNYRLCQFLAVGVGAFGGLVGLVTLLGGYRALCRPEGGHWRSELFLLPYFVLFGCVGGQLAWMLRPFIGSPALAFQLLRTADPEIGSFFSMLLHMLGG